MIFTAIAIPIAFVLGALFGGWLEHSLESERNGGNDAEWERKPYDK